MLDRIFNRSKLVEKAMDATWLRNDAISQNIANVDTPGYKRKTVPFEEYLNQAIDGQNLQGFRTNSRHIPIGGSSSADNIDLKVTEDNSSTNMRLDGNNVEIDSEMASMAKNSIKYNTLVESLNAGFSRLRSAINEGRK
jgi:flagellar basal-body rod protein FlgB